MRKYLTHQTIQECQFAKYPETLSSRLQDIYAKSRITDLRSAPPLRPFLQWIAEPQNPRLVAC